MLNHEITSIAGKHTRRRRVGRGTGSGHGKTCGRGHKGAGSRAGSTSVSLFSNYKFAIRCEIVNVCQLERFEDGASVGVEQLSGAGLINNNKSQVKILGKGDLTKKLQVTAHKFSRNAEQKITASGGIIKLA
jgi:large subunit ribosomal protein L15